VLLGQLERVEGLLACFVVVAVVGVLRTSVLVEEAAEVDFRSFESNIYS
jgi:hypothetical protein